MPIVRAMKLQWLRLIRLNDRPQKVAAGFAVGLMIGCIPFFGVQSILALSIAVVLRINKIACMIGSVWTNPLTAIPVYWSLYGLGLWFTGREGIQFGKFKEILQKADSSFFHLGQDFFIPLGIGCGLLAIVLGPLSFLVVYQVLVLRRNQRRAKALKAARQDIA